MLKAQPKIFAMRAQRWLLSLLLALVVCQTALAEIERIEPPFWWVGMHDSSLQLMVYGAAVGHSTVSTNASQVKITAQTRPDNVNYLFVDLRLSSTQLAGPIMLIFTAPDGTVREVAYEFRERRKESSERRGFSSKDVIYLITPDRFVNGDSNNDSVATLKEGVDRAKPGGRHGGDLIGVTDQLDYLHDLGVTQIWLNPLQENDQPSYSYHGYSISDLYNVDARLGGNPALLKLTEKAKGLGIGLIMDTIPNHIGENHWWMKDLPSRDWINNDGEFIQTSHRHEMIQDPYAATADKRAFNDGWFVPSMPDLNQRNPLLATYLIQNNIWWVEYADLSGLRVDTLPYADKDFTSLFSQRLLNEYPNLNIVGEEWSTNIGVVSYWQRGKLNQDGFDAGIPSLMDFPLQDALIKVLTAEQSSSESSTEALKQLHGILANDFQYPDAGNLVTIGDNHDMNRLFTWLGEDIRLYKMALGFLMTTRGIPQVFYGTEILMKNPGTEDHGIIRSDFPGGWPGDQRNAFTGAGMSQQELEAQQFVRTLLNWRKRSNAIHVGKLIHYLPEDGVYVYFRQSPDQLVMVLMNNSDEAKNVSTTRFSEITQNVNRMTDALSGTTSAFADTITVAAKATQIFELTQ